MTGRAVRLHRVLRAAPEKLFRAFTEAEALAKWLPPHGFTCTVHHLEARVGGGFRMSFRNFGTGGAHAFGGEYLALEPGRLVRYTDRFDGPQLPGVMEVAVQLTPVSCGTGLTVVQAGIPDAIPLDMCHLGWQESLTQLAALVEPDIPG
ncbi:SRPBCC family protein [Ottowia testudinis]|uniref:SRPBCC family protein n=1 Tax=Ottowia testudinis TaxID=2816950 RepID=A0A975CH17_9BURK|nr:SRPBCC family protein [Ottowia testudinis]QTD45429.1 SRPBCC family protein [Ottowia testudinis]